MLAGMPEDSLAFPNLKTFSSKKTLYIVSSNLSENNRYLDKGNTRSMQQSISRLPGRRRIRRDGMA